MFSHPSGLDSVARLPSSPLLRRLPLPLLLLSGTHPPPPEAEVVILCSVSSSCHQVLDCGTSLVLSKYHICLKISAIYLFIRPASLTSDQTSFVLMATFLTSCTYPKLTELKPVSQDKVWDQSLIQKQSKPCFIWPDRRPVNRFSTSATTKGSAKSSQPDEGTPSWAKPDSDEPPPWARDEGGNNASQQTFEIPFYVYLLASALTAIAAVGSAFEYINQKPVFGLINSDSIFYAPILGFFAFTGIPSSAFLWFKSVQVANKAAEEQDRRDGFL